MIKLIAIFALLLIIALIVCGVTPDYEKCYSEMERQGYAIMECCGGLTGGTESTDYLSEICIECPYLVLGCNPKEKENKNE